jgi:hypothetical protein
MSSQTTANQAFSHRFNADDALSPEAIANKIGAIGYRTKGMLKLVVDHLINNTGPEANSILGTLEAAIDAMDDLQEIKYLIDMVLLEGKTTGRNEEAHEAIDDTRFNGRQS